MLDWLWTVDGEERCSAILSAPLDSIEELCHSVEGCDRCPLLIVFERSDGTKSSLCFDCATESRIRKVLDDGGRFLKKGENIS